MGISVKELKELDESSYQIIDIRDQIEIAHGSIAGAIAIKQEEIENSVKIQKDNLVKICEGN